MPFQSEKQRRYLWANEPEIARDWTDTYGSGIAKALGGRIGFFKGAQADTASGKSMSPGTSASGGQRGGGGHHSGGDHRGPTTYTPPKQLTVTRPSHHIGAGDITQNYNKNLRTLALQDQYRQGAYQRAHPFLSKIRSGLGSLGRGIGHVARNFNPFSFAVDNPLMKLLMSGYGQGVKGVKGFAQYPTLDRWLNRDTDKYLNKPYRGQGYGYNFNEDTAVDVPFDPDARISDTSFSTGQGITGLDAYETFDDDVAASKELANLLTTRDQFPAYEEFGANQVAERDDLSEIEGQSAKLGRLPLIQMRVIEKKIKAPDIYGEPTPKEEEIYKKLKEMQEEEKLYTLPILT